MQWLSKAWYQRRWWCYLLWPVSVLYGVVIRLRRWLYTLGMLRATSFPVPLVVVGNVTTGGTGKTPLVGYLAKCSVAEGLRVGLVSRGYGGQSAEWPVLVTATSDPRQVGDEAVMLVQQTGCPMAVGPDRVAAIRALLASHQLDLGA